MSIIKHNGLSFHMGSFASTMDEMGRRGPGFTPDQNWSNS